MRKLIAQFMILTAIVAAFSSCAKPGELPETDGSGGGEYVFNYGEGTASSPDWYYKIAREVQEDGWVWTFRYYDLKDPNEDDSSLTHYLFYGFNMRYKDADSVLASGDRDLINSILDNDRSVEELLTLNPDDYEFVSIDKDMFFRLMHEALTGERHKEGTDHAYWDKQNHDLLIEPEYLSGYKFQLAYMNGAGCIDEFYIDILYQTGNGHTDYVQLSDLVDNGTATKEQMEAFDKIREIAENIKEQDSYFANAEDWRNLEIAGIDFSRLYTMLERVYWNQDSIYRENAHI